MDCKQKVKFWFKSKTFQNQIDTIIDDIYLTSIKSTDRQINKAQSAGFIRNHPRHLLSASDTNPLTLTEEVVRQADGLAQEVTDSIIAMLKDEGIYKDAPQTLERRIRELWNGEKYRATRFVRTFTADVATSTSLHRYQQQEIEEYQIYALIDGRTSPICRALHGTIFKVDSPEASRFHPPFHPFCRTGVLPITIFSDVSDSMRYENRDFSKQMKQDFTFYDNAVGSKVIKKVFNDIDTFNEKYRIDKFIFDEDIQKRFIRLGVQVNLS